MPALSEKRYLELTPPCENDSLADRERLLRALGEDVFIPLNALQALPDALQRADFKITATIALGAQGLELTNVEPGDTRNRLYGIALDVGSTALEMAIVDLNSGKTLARTGKINPEVKWGANILDRIFAVKADSKNLSAMRNAVCESISEMIGVLCRPSQIQAQEIAAMVVAGNTTMMHLLLGCDPWRIFQSPYAPAFLAPGFLPASALKLDLSCPVFIMPAVANYLGGDITSGLLMTDMDKSDAPRLFLDIGTNGELALGCRDYLIAGAGAAGPALEGAVSAFGMLAQPGAVDRVRIDSDNRIHIHTIGGLPPKGICGSGIVDLIAEGFLSGWINGNGTLNLSAAPEIRSVHDFDQEKDVPAIFFTPEMYFTETDIAEFIRCKAAAHTMVATLLEVSGATIQEIGKMYLSGGFGAHYDLESAITIGLYPDIPREKFCILGNSSLGGAIKTLLDRDCIRRVNEICARTTYVQFGEMDRFVENMVAAQFIPHTDASLYPSVKRRIQN